MIVLNIGVFVLCIAVSFVAAHGNACDKGAIFDSRCFNIPKEEVANLIY